ncbi:glycosyltransferase family 2 protein [Saliphagus infecundisoli]|uniref:Glycosyltransferase family 2 protein n=1 Tax=Saliphagus infecundisoli TaxID=1849069 RepID=A0ABD5QKS6_9EURY|nr:glycosyltransferase family 2 protein [Saliphagus infecundisoli]
MYRGHTIGVVVPAYNEADHVEGVLATLPGFVDRVYVVDDRSTDDTWDAITSFVESRDRQEVTDRDGLDEDPVSEDPPAVPDGGRAAWSRFVPIRHAENQGAGGALRTGYRHAHADGVDVTVAMDADGQMDPDRMRALLDPIVGGVADYTKGNRLGTGEDSREMPPFRLLGNRLLTALTKLSAGYWHLQDPQNGYTAISHRALAAIDLDRIPDDHDYTNDLLAQLNVAGMCVADVAMPAKYGDEESTIDYRTFVPATLGTLAYGFIHRMARTYLENGRYTVPALYAAATAGAAGSALAAIGVLGAAIGGSVTIWPALLVPVATVVLTVLAFVGGTMIDAAHNRPLGVTRT